MGDAMPITCLTKRELFAAMAMQGIIISEMMPFLLDFKGESDLKGSSWPEIAKYSCRMADALIAELEKDDA